MNMLLYFLLEEESTDMRARTLSLPLLALLLSSLPATAVTSSSPRSLLIRVHDVVTEGFTGNLAEVTTQIFRDGLIIEEAVSGGRCTHVLRAVASTAARAALNQALAQGRVGTQVGGCQVENHLVGNFTRDTTMTWFGARDRRNTFRVGDLVGTEPCPAEAELIRNAIDDYVQQASTTDPNVVFISPCEE
jgi:hypothetical protein